MKSVLIIDDDTEHNTLLAEELGLLGNLSVLTATTLKGADQALLDAPAGLAAMLVDVRMPDGDGRDWCKRVRDGGGMLPIILVSGMTDEEDVVRGLEAGADAYVRKPFRMSEILARLNTILARSDAHL